MENEVAVEEKTPLTRDEKIRKLEAQADAHAARAREFHRQYLELLVQKKEGKQIEGMKLKRVLESLPDGISEQAARERVLTMPLSSSDRQLNENIDRVREAEKFELADNLKIREEIKAIKRGIFDEKVDAHTRKVFKKFEDFLDSFKYTRALFYNELAPIIQEGYDFEAYFYRRGEKLGLNSSIRFSIEHHFRQGEQVYLMDVLEKIMNQSDAYGEALLEKDFNAGGWPSDPSSYFGYKNLYDE